AMAPYVELLHDQIYHKVFRATALVAVAVTVIAVALAYPFAMALARASMRWRIVLFAAVLTPLWISVLVRTFSWMLLLETNGPVNRMLVGAGVIERPLSLLFNQTGVLIGMVHVLLPYAVLPIYAALIRVDPALLRASEGLGASPLRTFLRVLLPLSMPGVATGAAFVFLLSLGFFITPALLGGASSITLSMLIDGFVNERLAWPLAAAASMILLVATLVFLALAGRFVVPSTMAEVR
ncbi:MAG: ABC transporter permease, partial [Alphaproteobacteria bacterium]